MRIHSTEHYHRYDLQTLGWELTVCNSLMPQESPCRKILKANQSYGELLYAFLADHIPFENIHHIIEIGGGYGYLMRDFLQRHPRIKATMVDLSPYLLEQQKRLLANYSTVFRLEDFLETNLTVFGNVDMAILNENLGDFPTVLDIDREMLPRAPRQEGLDYFVDVMHFITTYGLEIPSCPFFHFNLGAAKTVEKLCAAGIPVIFLSEHSCEANSPDLFRRPLHLSSTGLPARIALRGHDEYTIQFSHLEKIALAHHYHVKRGPMADYIPLNITDRILCCLSAAAPRTDEDEIIKHFIEDLYQYEYLLLTKPSIPVQYSS